jgi:hypothetical protein
MGSIPSGITILWPGTHASIPTGSGWTRVTSMDNIYGKTTTGSPAPNGTAGSATHTHTTTSHTHNVASHTHSYTTPVWTGNLWIGNGNFQSYGPMTGKNHTHGPVTSGSAGAEASGGDSPTWNTPTTDPAYYTMIYIQSDGTPTGFPDDCVVYYNNASAPTDWVQHGASVGRFIKGPTTGANGGGGAAAAAHVHSPSGSHTHTASGNHTHGGGDTGAANQSGGVATGGMWTAAYASHTHSWTVDAGAPGAATATTGGNAGGTTYEPPYFKLLGIQNTSGADNWLEEGIVMWLGSIANIPDDWTLCDGGNNDSGNATPVLNGTHILMAASGGGDVTNTGGTAGHTHSNPSTHTHPSNAHSHSTPITGGNIGNYYGSSNYTFNSSGADYAGGHPAGNTGTATPAYGTGIQTINADANTEPAYRRIAYLSAPEEPSSGNAVMFGTNI